MQNAGLDEARAGIKIAGRNINHLRYADDTTVMAESEELKNLLMKVRKQSEKPGLKLNIKKTNIMTSSLITSCQIDGETMAAVRDLLLGGTSLLAQTVMCLPTMRETRVQSLGREDLLEKEMATHSSILAWKIPWREKPSRLQSMGSQRVEHD